MEAKNKYTAAAMRALRLAAEMAEADNSALIGTEHLLLGLAAETEGTAGVVLREYGVDEKAPSPPLSRSSLLPLQPPP